MLINCPECQLQVSDKAINCPHCGYPLKKGAAPRPCTKKHMRLPNGFGQITMIKGHNLRKPYRAMITVGKTETGRPICKPLKPSAYFATYNEAYEALVEYNRNPYDLEACITVKELYEEWSSEYFKTIKDSSARNIKAAWKHCTAIYGLQVKTIRNRHIKGCIDQEGISDNMASRIKSMFNLMLDYAVEYEIVDRNHSRTFNVEVDRDAQNPHAAYTDDEIQQLWKYKEDLWVWSIVFQIYTGWRPSELLELRLENINLKDMTIIGGMKTNAGLNRLIPIHPRIQERTKNCYKMAKMRGDKYLFSENGKKISYDMYKTRFNKALALAKVSDHRPHDGRKTFVSLAKRYNMDEYAIKHIVGHEIDDLTERVYTERSIEWLRSEVSKISLE